MEKILSIIIPTYNMERYLDKCLSSLIVNDEKMASLEVIVVNDGSKDGSLQIAQSFEAKYPATFVVIDKKNGNYGSCINAGLKIASGKYVKVLDSDDSFDNSNFQVLLEKLEKCESDCVVTDFELVYEDGTTLRTYRCNTLKEGHNSLNDLKEHAIFIQMHAVCYKKAIFDKIDYHQTEGLSYTDQEWMFLPMSFSNEIAYYPIVVYKYLVGRSGQTVNPKTWDKNFWQEIKGLEVMIETQKHYLDQSSVEGKCYQNIRIQARVRNIYRAYFLKFNTFSNNENMIKFDKLLKDYDDTLYHSFDEYHISRVFPYRYIKAWRKHYRPSFIMHRLNRFVYGLLCVVKRTPQY